MADKKFIVPYIHEEEEPHTFRVQNSNSNLTCVAEDELTLVQHYIP